MRDENTRIYEGWKRIERMIFSHIVALANLKNVIASANLAAVVFRRIRM